jgi:hypothetical protein
MPVVDSRLKHQLNASGLNYEASSSYLRGVLELPNGRSQIFLIDPTTDKVGDHEDHDILSPVADLVSHEAGVRSKAFELLKFSGTRRLGHVCVIGTTVVFKADCSVTASPAAFRSVVEAVCTVADALEKVLTNGLDDF